MSYYSRYGWQPYVSVGKRKAQADKKIKALNKKGMNLSPVQPEGTKIATTFWGKSWCQNLESYSDYSNRLPRGRSYLRYGSVLDLKIEQGKVMALVQGSSLYKVEISITRLSPEVWKNLIKDCSGKIESLIELLQGSFPKSIMEVMTRSQTGLFPHPRQIKLSCSCPDWADMCKHVAGVMYGIGTRLDERPELLFTLRQVHHEELIAKINVEQTVQAKAEADVLLEQNLENIFGIELDASKSESTPPLKTEPNQKKQRTNTRARTARTKKSSGRDSKNKRSKAKTPRQTKSSVKPRAPKGKPSQFPAIAGIKKKSVRPKSS